MPSKIILKKSSVAAKAPVAADLEFGELALNYTDSKLYFKKADGTTIDAFSSSAAAGTVTSVGVTPGTGIAVSGSPITTSGNITVTNTAPNVTTDISITTNASNVVVNSSDGTDGTINAATTSLAGVMTSADKTKLDGIAAGAQVNVATNLAQGTRTTTTVPVTSSTGTTATINAATTSLAGVMTSADKTKLDGIAAGAQVNVATNLAQGTRTTTTVPVTSSTGTTATLDAATTSLAGIMSSADKTKLDGIAAGATANTGTVTSVATSGTVSGLTLTGGTITTSGTITLGGTLAVTPSNFASQTANTVLAAPNGVAGVPTFRALVAADIPTLNQNTTGASSRISIPDTRAVDDQPQNKVGYSITADFKNNTAVNNPPVNASGIYSHIITVAGWDTNGGSGGWPTQLSVGTQGMAYRQAASATTWANWTQFVTNNGGTWGINVTGTAANVTGTVAVANGGTGATTAAAALTNLGAYAASNPSAYITTAGARSALSFTAGSGAYNSTSGVITIPTNTNQLTNGAGYITSAALSSYLPLTGGNLTTGASNNLFIGRNSTATNYNAISLNGNPADSSNMGLTGGGVGDTTLYINSPGSINVRTSSFGNSFFFSGSSFTAPGDVRAPIFYDSNDTGYYIDPSSYSRIRQLTLTQARVDSSKYPVGHYAPGEEVFAIDPTWTQDQIREYFNSNNVSWVADSTAPGGYAIQLTGAINVGGVYGSGFPYIPVETDDTFYMEVYIKNVSGSNTHYMGSVDFNHNFSNLGGNPGSFGYWVMSNSNPGTGWTKYSGYISGFGTAQGQFVSGTEYWTPLALFNYSGGGTSYISGWKVLKLTKGIVGRFPNSTVNTGEAWYGRANDRNRGTYTIQLGGGSSSGRQFEVVDYAWSSVMFKVSSDNFSESAGSSRAPLFYDSNNTGYYADLSSTGTSINAAGSIIAGGNVTAYSDENLKTDWSNLPVDYVEQLSKLLSGTFTRKDTNERQAGVGAQSLQKFLPEVVIKGVHLSVAYGNAAMVSAVELAKRVVEQDARIAKLEERLSKLLDD